MGETNTTADEATPEAEKPKRQVHWKPIWVAIPAEFEDVAITDALGDSIIEKRAKTYKVHRCEGKKAARAVLAAAGLDVTNCEHVLVFRADPLDLKLTKQVIFKF